MNLYDARNAFAEHKNIQSALLFAGADQNEPDLSICVPTFRRGALLIESLRSALDQDWNGAYEIVVVDNDPESQILNTLLSEIPILRKKNFRYYRNAENIGMFGNWNRSIELGRGVWHTMLHDDDLLMPDFASKMMSILLGAPHIHGLICRKRSFVTAPGETKILWKRAAKRIFLEARFWGAPVRRYRPDLFFWGASNPVGLVVRKEHLLAMGGYQSDEYPVSDYLFALRYALRHPLYEARYLLAYIRTLENESLRPEVIFGMIVGFHAIRDAMTGSIVPRWWSRLSPLVTERYRNMVNADRHAANIERERLAQAVGVPLPRDRPMLLNIIRSALRGF